MMVKKFIYQHCNSHQIKVIIARSEYKEVGYIQYSLNQVRVGTSVPI